MSKTVPAPVATHLNQTLTTLGMGWKVVRTDGTIIRVNSVGKDITADFGFPAPFAEGEQTYTAGDGLSRTNLESDAEMNVDNMEVAGVLSGTQFKSDELRRGLFNGAKVFVFTFNHRAPTDGAIRMFRGKFGQIRVSPKGFFHVEMRSFIEVFRRSLGELYSKDCRADLGDDRCGTPIQPSVLTRGVPLLLNEFYRVNQPTSTLSITNPGAETGVAGWTNETGTLQSITPVAATGVLTLTANAADTETVTIDTKVYQFQTALTDVDGNVLIGATASDSLDNLIAAITLGAGSGTLYATSMTLHPTVTGAAGAGDTVDATAKSAGTAGNSIVTTETMGTGSWGGGTLSGGTGVAPNGGVDYFSGGAAEAETKARQDVSVPGGEETAVDAGNRQIRVSWYQQSIDEATDDQAEMTIRFLDGSMVQIGAETSAGLTSTVGSWTRREIFIDVPALTRTLRIAMRMVRQTAPDNDGLVDDVGLHLFAKTPTQVNFGERIFKVTTAGTTDTVQPDYDLIVGNSTTDGTAVLIAEEAWSRTVVVTAVDPTDPRRKFTVTELTPFGGVGTAGRDFFPEDVMNEGACFFELGNNAGVGLEVRNFEADDGITIEQIIELYKDLPFDVEIGDSARIFRGCDKTQTTCVNVFANALRAVAEWQVPGPDVFGEYPDAR